MTVSNSDLTILDGGMGRELQARGLAKRGSVWSALALVEAPDVVADVHREFVEAGAEVIITNNYSVVPLMLDREGWLDRFDELLIRSGEIAASVRDSATAEFRIAGALPPLHTSYTPAEVGVEADNIVIYQRIAERLSPHVDLFVCETMSSAAEARSAVRAAALFDKPIWVAWALSKRADGTLLSGETIEEAYERLAGLPIDAFLFNCSTPEAISAALPRLRERTAVPIGGYANSFGVPPEDGGPRPLREELTPEAYAATALEWRASGASIIGGCCGISPKHINVMAHALREP